MLRNYRGTTVARRAMIGAIALLVPALAGCEAGLNAPTLEFHPASNGAHAVVDNISINNLFVLGPASGSTIPVGGSAAVFLALYNNSAQSDTLVGVSAPGTAAFAKLEKGAVNVAPGSSSLLTGPRPEVVLTKLTKPLRGGQTITITLDFSNTGAVTLKVPVEPHDFYYDAYSPAPSAAPSAKASASASPKASSSASPAASSGATTSPSPSATATK